MSLGKGSIYSTSIRQKLNTKSSTEAELVGVADVIPMALWKRYFLESQCYKFDGPNIFQDNQSEILLEKNGRTSSSNRTRHIDMSFFLVAYQLKVGEVSFKHCPTDDMVGDYLTKPLQGAKFIKFRDTIINVQNG